MENLESIVIFNITAGCKENEDPHSQVFCCVFFLSSQMVQNFQCFVKAISLEVEFKLYFALKHHVADCCLLNDTQMEFGLIILIVCVFISIKAFQGKVIA